MTENEEIILKPLSQCFGSGVMYLKNGDKNTSVIIDSITNKGKQLTMVQKYIKNAEFGDKRVLILVLARAFSASVLNTKTPSKTSLSN